MQERDENFELFEFLSRNSPSAEAKIRGGESYPDITGKACFYELPRGIIMVTLVENLPPTETNIFAYHIHDGKSCENNFALTGEHYNPFSVAHPNHAGDLPPLFSMGGSAWFALFDERFTLSEIIGKTVIIHDNVDDFTSQPSGNAGNKIACGVITKTNV